MEEDWINIVFVLQFDSFDSWFLVTILIREVIMMEVAIKI